MKRQYMGCARRVANGINTVHLSYVREKTGHVLAGARQWIPAEDIKDPAKSLVMGLPLDLRFRTTLGACIDDPTTFVQRLNSLLVALTATTEEDGGSEEA